MFLNFLQVRRDPIYPMSKNPLKIGEEGGGREGAHSKSWSAERALALVLISRIPERGTDPTICPGTDPWPLESYLELTGDFLPGNQRKKQLPGTLPKCLTG